MNHQCVVFKKKKYIPRVITKRPFYSQTDINESKIKKKQDDDEPLTKTKENTNLQYSEFIEYIHSQVNELIKLLGLKENQNKIVSEISNAFFSEIGNKKNYFINNMKIKEFFDKCSPNKIMKILDNYIQRIREEENKWSQDQIYLHSISFHYYPDPGLALVSRPKVLHKDEFLPLLIEIQKFLDDISIDSQKHFSTVSSIRSSQEQFCLIACKLGIKGVESIIRSIVFR